VNDKIVRGSAFAVVPFCRSPLVVRRLPFELSMKSIAQAVPGALIALLSAAPTSPGKVEFAWNAAVGPALRRATNIRLEGTQLIVDAATVHWAREIVRSSRIILSRLQAFLGKDCVTEIIVRQP
jgi:hypothetical protein